MRNLNLVRIFINLCLDVTEVTFTRSIWNNIMVKHKPRRIKHEIEARTGIVVGRYQGSVTSMKPEKLVCSWVPQGIWKLNAGNSPDATKSEQV